jgi:hypothetical protein
MQLSTQILLTAVLFTNSAIAQDCIMKERTTSKEIGRIHEIKNVVAEVNPFGKGQYKCTASLEGYTGGKWHQGKGEFIWSGDYSHAKACGAATELAKKNLLTGLYSSTITSETFVVCKEQEEKDRPLLNPKIGTIIDDVRRLRAHTNYPNAFYHNGEECRWYLETGWNGKDIIQFQGIVCRYGPTKWIIVDKF